MELSALHFISWENFHTSSFELAKKIQDSGEKFDTIVAISRGGLVLARILSDFLKLGIYNIAIESYLDIDQKKEPRVTQNIGSAEIAGKRILLVDEICDSGKTFERALTYLNSAEEEMSRPAAIKTACLVFKSKSLLKPDYYQDLIDKWVVFPYEVRETIEELKDKMSREKFVELGFDSKMVEELYK